MKSNDKLGGLVHDVEFNDMCIRGSGSPDFDWDALRIDGAPRGGRDRSNKPPQYTDIRLSNILIEGGGGIGGGVAIGIDGLDAAHRLSIAFHNVMEQPAAARTSARHAEIALDGTNFTFTGEDVTVTGKPSQGTGMSCDGRFVAFPVPVSDE